MLDQFGGTLHTPVSHSGNIYNNDVVNIALDPNPAGTTGLTFSGSEGHDELTGNAGADTLSGLGGNDTIVGGSGVDTAAYTATISTSGITDDGAGHFVVATGGSEGTDTLSGVEKIDGAGSHNILLVGNGGYATIQAAVNAAADGDTIEIAAGTYTEDVTITGKALTIDGVENGSANSVTLNGQVTVAGTLNGAFAITDLNINATGKDYGVRVTANSTAFAGSVTLDDVSISNAKQDGFAYIRVGNESIPRLGDTIGAVSILNSQFHNNATASSPASGRADILLFGYNQDLTITNVVIDTPGAFAQKAIQMRGIEDLGNVVNVGPYHQAGDVAINNLTITGAYGQDVMAFYRIAGFDSFTGANNSVNVTRSVNASSNATLEPWAVINMDEVGGSIDLSSFFSSASNLASANGGPGVPSWIATLQGLGGNEIFIGTSGTDTLVGRGGNDILNGGAGADAMQGGAGNDTYLVDNAGDVVMENASEGTDLVQSSVSFTLGANVDNLTLTGSANINGTGNGDANVITGNSGNNTLDGGVGADTMIGGDGNDTYVVDNAGDVVTEAATVGSGTDTVQSSISYTLGANVENLTLTGSGNINGTGNGDANVITGNSGNNILTGGGGNDTLVGGAGIDTAVLCRHADRGQHQGGRRYRSGDVRRPARLAGDRVERRHRYSHRRREDHRRRRPPLPARRQRRLRQHRRRHQRRHEWRHDYRGAGNVDATDRRQRQAADLPWRQCRHRRQRGAGTGDHHRWRRHPGQLPLRIRRGYLRRLHHQGAAFRRLRARRGHRAGQQHHHESGHERAVHARWSR